MPFLAVLVNIILFAYTAKNERTELLQVFNFTGNNP